MNLTGKTLERVTEDIRAFAPIPESDAKDANAINRAVLKVDLKEKMHKDSEEEQRAVVIGINPSTAIEGQSDRTITVVSRCMKALGYTEMIMLNLFTYRQTELEKIEQDDMAGNLNRTKFNSEENKKLLKDADVIIAWGMDSSFSKEKKMAYDEIVESVPEDRIWCVEKKGRYPVHPRVWTYSKDCKLVPYRNVL